MNRVVLQGYVGQPVKTQYFKFCHPISCQFPLLIETKNRSVDVDITSIPVIVGGTAIDKVRYLTPGTQVFVTGSITIRSAEQSSDCTSEQIVVLVEHISLLNSSSKIDTPAQAQAKKRQITVDLEYLATLYGSNTTVRWYVSKRTGEILPEDCLPTIPDDLYEYGYDNSLLWEDYLLISHQAPADFSQEMQDFIESVPDPSVARQLERAILREHPLQEFEAVLSEQYTDQARWERWKAKKVGQQLAKHLSSEGIEILNYADNYDEIYYDDF